MATGCPLHNLIPEWNNLVYLGKWKLGLERLLKTSNFPEFTSRVCPALCENACTCGLHGDAVTVKIIKVANGKVSLSIKALEDDKEAAKKAEETGVEYTEDAAGTSLGDLLANIKL